MCAGHRCFGGDCPSDLAYFGAEAWNTRPSTPSEDDVERVARALAKADGKDPDAPAWVRQPGNETFGVCWRDHYSVMARAALATQGDPT
jgi:hypothetical protein